VALTVIGMRALCHVRPSARQSRPLIRTRRDLAFVADVAVAASLVEGGEEALDFGRSAVRREQGRSAWRASM
jgi:hypothetical protein